MKLQQVAFDKALLPKPEMAAKACAGVGVGKARLSKNIKLKNPCRKRVWWQDTEEIIKQVQHLGALNKNL